MTRKARRIGIDMRMAGTQPSSARGGLRRAREGYVIIGLIA